MFSLHPYPPWQQLFFYVASIMNVILCFQDKSLQSMGRGCEVRATNDMPPF